jgi:hypothetical protein
LRWRARLAFVGASACAGLVGQAIGLGLLDWPPGGLPGFPWWEPPAANASPGSEPGRLGWTIDDLPVADASWLVPPWVFGGPQEVLPAERMPGALFIGPSVGARPLLAGTSLPPVLAPAPGTAVVPTPRAGDSSVLALPDVAGASAEPAGDTAHLVTGDVTPVAGSVVGVAGDVVGTATGVVSGVARVPGDVVATAGDVVGDVAQTVGDVGRVPTTVVDTADHVVAATARTVGDVGQVPQAALDTVKQAPKAVADTASAAAATVKAVDKPVADLVKQVHVPKVQAPASDQATADAPSVPVRPKQVVRTVVDDATGSPQASSSKPEHTSKPAETDGRKDDSPTDTAKKVLDVVTSSVPRSR